MDELDLFRDFRRGVADPSGDVQRQASARLARAIEGGHGRGTRVLRLIRKRPERTALALAALAGATATALFVGTPWKDSPGFLARAQAALTPDAGTILHYKWVTTSTSTDPACTVTRGPSEIWIDQTPPHRYRVLLHDLPPYPDVCSIGTLYEFGGPLAEPAQIVTFVPPDTLSAGPPPSVAFLRPPDPVRDFREAISAGTAHDEGQTQLDGRTVERIRLDVDHPYPPSCPAPSRPRETGYAYVDPESFYPVQMERPLAYVLPGCSVVRVRAVSRTLTFEYLPRTAANLALTDIQAQHPNATGP